MEHGYLKAFTVHVKPSTPKARELVDIFLRAWATSFFLVGNIFTVMPAACK